jgi:hypothetical protein
MIILKAIFLSTIALWGSTAPAYAYIDPGAGSLLLQALAALGVGLLFYIRRIIDAVKRLFGRSSPDKPHDPPSSQ